jgi:hypothetical protein
MDRSIDRSMDIDKPPDKAIQLSVSYPPEEAYEILRYCKKMQIGKSALMRLALEQYLAGRGVTLR